MDYDKIIERWRNLANRWENGEQLLLNGTMRVEDELRIAATAIETLRAELAQMAACVYYKQGSLCRLGGADPANVCVMGPYPNQVSVWNLLTEMVLCPERLPAWVRPEMAPPAEDTLVLVIAAGRPAHGTILDHAVLLAKWHADEGWVLEEYPAYEGPEIHFWAPIPALPEEARP